jgi:hypothetical protein
MTTSPRIQTLTPANLTGLPSDRHPKFGALLDLGFELARCGARAGAGLENEVRKAGLDLVRRMNCFHSNRIEDNAPTPTEAAQALDGVFSENAEIRGRQQRVVGYFGVHKAIDTRTLMCGETPTQQLRAIHKLLFDHVAPEFRIAERGDGTTARLVPGEYRVWNRSTPRRTADAIDIPDFMRRFDKFYGSMAPAMLPIGIACAHHRLLLIRPFADENGPTSRLWTHLQLCQADLCNGLWSIPRGLSLAREAYVAGLSEADREPIGMLDGRGCTSEEGLVRFCRFFLETCVGQAKYISALFEPSSLRKRMSAFVENEAREGRLDRRVGAVMERAVTAGIVHKGDCADLMNVEFRQARRLLEPLRERGLLTSDGIKSPLHLAFPLDEAEAIFPGMIVDTQVLEQRNEFALAI